ncbi:hypothetical protein [Formosa maritima]|uniref:Glycine zipper family protein n=1 Tax=Formosa maritima TaxID=2592046 RepID=A0A5D0GAG1_9FLAO|nr:hypothetical protein [Formosa maritima]TYA55289.1 hypothetical protein FVF61_07545 [Formosa maritima]
MTIKELKERPRLQQNKKLTKMYAQLDTLLIELRKRDLPEQIVQTINLEVDILNSVSEQENELKPQIKKTQARILKLLEKELKIVPKNYHRNVWLALGIGAFGVPMGVAFGTSLGNMSYIAIGIPIGMALGLAIGTTMDKKALEEGRQLDISL